LDILSYIIYMHIYELTWFEKSKWETTCFSGYHYGDNFPKVMYLS
jgi:hypothetical protein